MNSIAPNIFVNDINATINYYKLMGFKISMSVPEEGDFAWVMMTNGDVNFMFQTFDSIGSGLPAISRKDGGSLLLYIKMKEIKQFYEEIKDKVNVITELEKTFYNAIEFSVLDNNGYVLTFSEHED